MKRVSIGLILALAPALVLAEGSLRAQISAFMGPVDHALLVRDAKAFSAMLKPHVTNDFKYSEPGGKPMAFDGMVAGIQQGIAMYSKVLKAQTKLLLVQEKGDKGTAVAQHMTEATMLGPDKKSHTMIFVGTSTDTYRKVGGKWLLAGMVMRTDKMTMDGKPAPMGPPGK